MKSGTLVAALTATVCSAQASSRFVSPPTDLKTTTGYAGIQVRYKEVPAETCETTPGVKSFSGYADVDKDRHFFFWFFEARETDPDEAPLTVYYEGGPGASSMIGLFQSLGPCGIDYEGNLYNNPYALNRKTNLLFVDQPETVGLSYTKTMPGYANFSDEGVPTITPLDSEECPDNVDEDQCGTFSVNDECLVANSTAAAAPNMWKTLQGFMGAFPQYSRQGIHIATESYGGRYGPIFADYFLAQNEKKIEGATAITLESMYINNGWFDAKIGYTAYYNISQDNTYDLLPYQNHAGLSEQIRQDLYGANGCLAQLDTCYQTGDDDDCSDADDFCIERIQEPFANVAGRAEDDFRYLSDAPFPYDFYPGYLNRREIQHAIGAFTNFTEESGLVGARFGATGDDSRDLGLIEIVGKLVDQGIRVNLLAGDADYTCAWLGVQEVAARVQAPGYDAAGFADLQTSDKVTHGQVRQAGNFAFVRVFYAGHLVPFYQPLAMLELFERQLAGTDLATGQVPLTADYRTQGPAASTFREGIDTVTFVAVPGYATYNTTTHRPNPYAEDDDGGDE